MRMVHHNTIVLYSTVTMDTQNNKFEPWLNNMDRFFSTEYIFHNCSILVQCVMDQAKCIC